MKRLARAVGWLALLIGAAAVAGAPAEIRLWRHETTAEELEASFAAIDRFNRTQPRWHISVETLPQGTYTSSITAAALAGQLPCIFTLDQPVVPNFAWTGHLRPLQGLVSEERLRSLNSGAKGTYRGLTYSVGQSDVVLLLFARRSILERYGVRVASTAQPYSAAEFLEILRRIKRANAAEFPLDLNSADGGEWMSYAFGPWVQSAGGDLIDRKHYQSADGFINGPAARSVALWYQGLFREGLAEQRVVDNQSLMQGRAVFHYSGSWEADRYRAAFKDDLVLMPPPDFGHGPKVGAGSWQWGISSSCPNPKGAAEFLDFLLSPEEIAAFSRARSLIPTTDAGASMTMDYRVGGPLRMLYDMAKNYGVKRPETPGYPKISAAFEKAFLDIKYGKPVEDALDFAADAIEQDIARNHGYGFGG